MGRTSNFEQSGTAKMAAAATARGMGAMGSVARTAGSKINAASGGKIGAGAQTLKNKMAGGARALANPVASSGMPPAAQQGWESKQMAQDLAEKLTPQEDYRMGAAGNVELTPSGAAKMSGYRQDPANQQRFHTTKGQSNMQVANSADLRGALAHKAVAGEAPPKANPVTAAIADQLQTPSSALGSPDGGASWRTNQATAIAAQSGGSWASAQRKIGELNGIMGRSATAADGTRFGIVPSTVGMDKASKATRDYTAAIGSPYSSVRPTAASGEDAFGRAQSYVASKLPQGADESHVDYDARMYKAMFLSETDPQSPLYKAPATAGTP
jgi:hypothetical protein